MTHVLVLLLATLGPPLQMEIRLTPSAHLKAPTKTRTPRVTSPPVRATVAAPSRGKASWRLLQARHHVLHDRVVLQRVHAQVLAVAGLLEAAMGHLRDERDVVVDPHAPEAKRPRDTQRASHVARPHR